MTTINRSISTRSSSLHWKETLTENLKTFRSSEQKMTTSKEEWYRILNLKSCIVVWMNFLMMNEGWSLQYILKIKRKTRWLVFYIPLSKTLTKRNVGFCASLTNFWNRNKKRLLNVRLLPLYKCKENKSSLSILKIEYQHREYVNPAAGIKSRQPEKPYAMTVLALYDNERQIWSFKIRNSFPEGRWNAGG